MPPPSIDTAALAELHRLGGGAVSIWSVPAEAGPALLVLADRGNKGAALAASVIGQTLQAIRAEDGARATYHRCAACGITLAGRTGFGFSVVQPAIDSPDHAIVVPICTACGATEAEMQRRTADVIRRVCPAFRTFRVTNDGGRA